MLEMKNEIQSKVRTEVDRQQREYFLHQRSRPSRTNWVATPSSRN